MSIVSSKHSRRYSPQFKREAVELYRRSGKSIVVIATEIDVAPESLRKWAKQQQVDDGLAEGLTSTERDELRRLRSENQRLKMERDLLKRAAAFFAQETETR
jgi:transposase